MAYWKLNPSKQALGEFKSKCNIFIAEIAFEKVFGKMSTILTGFGVLNDGFIRF